MQIPPEMAEVMRLTRAGKLGEATAAIQRLLHPRGAAPAASASNTIDAEYTVVESPSIKPPAELVSAVPPVEPVTGGSGAARSGIADTLKGLAARFQRAMLEPVLPGPSRKADVIDAPMPPPGARGRSSFTAASFSNAAGGRAYKLFVPANRRGQPSPLIVMLHGCTQNPDDFAAGTGMNAVAEEYGCIVAYPAGSGQPAEVLELVQSAASAARRRGAVHHRGHHAPGDGGACR
jgi:Esterase PHB depolymerase